MKKKKTDIIDYSKAENQIGCGYCIHEKMCERKISAIEKNISTKETALSCSAFKHYSNE